MNQSTIVRKKYQNHVISKILGLSLFIVLFNLLSSCQNDQVLKGEAVNLYGGTTRNNSYERFGSFVVSVAENEKILSADSSGSMTPPLAISSFQTVCATVNGSVLQCTSAMLEWSAKLDGGAYVISGMCADQAHNIYAAASDGSVYSFATDGKRRFKTKIPGEGTSNFQDLLALQDGIIVTSTGGTVTKLSLEGKVMWQFISNLSTVGTASADAGNNVYVTLTHNDFEACDSLVKILKDGKQLWMIGFTARLLTLPVLSKDIIAIGAVQQGNRPVVIALNYEGKAIWTKELKATPRGVSVTSEGSVVTVSYNSGVGIPQSSVEQFSASGVSEWNLNFDTKISTPALISKDNIAVVGVKNSAVGVYLINRSGVLDTYLSLDNAPSLILKPTVASGSIIFAAASNGYITRVGAKRGLLPI